MQKKQNSHLYAIVDATDAKAVSAVKGALQQFSPKVREGRTLVIGGSERIMFIEIRKREGPMFDILKNLARTYCLYPCYVIEEDKNLLPKSDKFGNECKYFVVDCAVMDLPIPEDGFAAWQEKFRAVAKEIYRENSVFLKMHTYKRDENRTIHAIIGNTENANRQGGPDNAVLGEKGWSEAVLKMAEKLGVKVEFRKVRYKNL